MKTSAVTRWEVHMYNLRKKLGKQFIRTVHGVGYVLGKNDETAENA